MTDDLTVTIRKLDKGVWNTFFPADYYLVTIGERTIAVVDNQYLAETIQQVYEKRATLNVPDYIDMQEGTA